MAESQTTDLRLHLHNAGTAEWVLRIRRMQPEDGLKEMMRISQLCVDALDALERLDADAAAEKAEAASWKAVAHDHSERLQRLANKCAALTLVAYGTPENPRDPLAPGGSKTQPNIAAGESGTAAASLVKELRELHAEIIECDEGRESPMMALVRRAADALSGHSEPEGNQARGMCQIANRPACDSYPRCQCGQTLPPVTQGFEPLAPQCTCSTEIRVVSIDPECPMGHGNGLPPRPLTVPAEPKAEPVPGNYSRFGTAPMLCEAQVSAVYINGERQPEQAGEHSCENCGHQWTPAPPRCPTCGFHQRRPAEPEAARTRGCAAHGIDNCLECNQRTKPEATSDPGGHRWEISSAQPGGEWCPRCGSPRLYAGLSCNPLNQQAEPKAECPHCREVYEIWANTEGFTPVHATEGYLQRAMEQMRDAAARGLAVNRPAEPKAPQFDAAAIHRVCHSLSGTCEMILHPENACTPENCVTMRTALDKRARRDPPVPSGTLGNESPVNASPGKGRLVP